MFPSALGTSGGALLVVVVSAIGVYLALVVFSRLAGLRSFSEMTNFDLAATVAFGSLVATTAVSTTVSLLQGVVGLVALFGIQAGLARLRRMRLVARAVDNQPLLLMRDGVVLTANLQKAQMTQNDLRSKLRLAGVTRFEQVGAVVLETTGETSVLLVSPDGRDIDPALLGSVASRDETHGGALV